MDQIVECPRCATALQINRAHEHALVICPSCQWNFDASQAIRRKAEADTPIPSREFPSREFPSREFPSREFPSREFPSGESIDRPTAAVPDRFGTLAPTQSSSSDDDVIPNAIKRLKTKRAVRHRKRKSPWPTILGLLGLTALVAMLGGFVHFVRQRQFEVADVQNENEMRAQPAPRAPTPSSRATADASESTDEIRRSEPDDFSLEMANPEPAPVPRELEPVPVDPIRRLLETLGQSGEQCEAFQFLPENELQYERLQSFAQQLAHAKALLADDQVGEIDSRDRESLTERSVHWLQTMKALVTQVVADAPERLSRINAFAKREFEEANSFDKMNSQIIFYGFLFFGGDEEPDFILKFDRKQVYFTVPAIPGFEQTSDEFYRVFFVEMPETPSQKRMHSPGGGLITVSSANLVYAFDPMGSEN